MSMFIPEDPRNEPRPPRNPMPSPRTSSRGSQGSVAKRPSAGSRMGLKPGAQARPQMPKQEAKPSQTKARIQDSRTIVPGGPGADTFQNDMMGAVMPFLTAPSRVARGAVEGGIQAINPDFEMPDYSNAQIPGVDFMNFITGSAAQDQGRRMPMQRNIDPGTDAILRAIMMRMQGGQ